jgi:hypothetical protein
MAIFPERISHTHFHWFSTICLDLLILAVFMIWFMAVTPGSPMSPDPSTGRTFEMLVPVGSATSGSGLRAMSHTVFAPGYVDFPTFIIGWLLIGNTTLLILGCVWSFFRQL